MKKQDKHNKAGSALMQTLLICYIRALIQTDNQKLNPATK